MEKQSHGTIHNTLGKYYHLWRPTWHAHYSFLFCKRGEHNEGWEA